MINRNIVSEMDLPSFRVYMMNTSNLNLIKSVTTEGVNPRIVMICYMIRYFKNEMFNKTSELLELLLFYQAENIINLFEERSNQLPREYNRFMYNFQKWKKIDAELLSTQMTDSLKQLEIYKNLNLSNDQISNIESKQDFIKRRLDIIQTHYRIENTDSNHESDILEETIKRAFWELFKDSLKRFETKELSEQDIKWIVEIIDEIKTELNKLTPNNSKIIEENNDSLDTELIEQLIARGAFDSEYLVKLVKFMISRIQLLQAPVDDTPSNEWKKNVIELLEYYNAHFYEVLPLFFEDMHKKIKRIHMQLSEYEKN
jgi:hypothetical protein